MADLTRNRDTIKFNEETLHLNYPVKGGVHLYAGTIVGLDAAGRLVSASTATKIAGRLTAEVDATNYTDGQLTVNVEEGIYWLDNSASADLIAQADVGGTAYVVDNHTVAKTSNTGARIACGRIINVDPVMGVAVQCKSITRTT